MLQTSTLARISALVVLGLTTAGCELVGGIFKAGVWMGALGIIAVAVLVMVVVTRFRR